MHRQDQNNKQALALRIGLAVLHHKGGSIRDLVKDSPILVQFLGTIEAYRPGQRLGRICPKSGAPLVKGIRV